MAPTRTPAPPPARDGTVWRWSPSWLSERPWRWWALLAALPFLGSGAVALLNFSAEGFVWVVRAVEGGLDGWAILRRVAQGIGEAVSTPGVTGGLVVVELVGVAALYALHRLLRIGREPRSKEEKQW